MLNNINKRVVKRIFDFELQFLEKEMVVSDPQQFPSSVHQVVGEWVDYEITKGFPDGVPWDNEPGKRREPDGRNTFIFMAVEATLWPLRLHN